MTMNWPTSKQKWVMMLAGVAMTSLKIYRKEDVEKYRIRSLMCGRKVHVESKVEVIPVTTAETENHIVGT